MKKHSWIILVCTVIAALAGGLVAKSQPPAYLVNSTLLVTSLPSFGTGSNTQETSTTVKNTLTSEAVNDAAEILTRSVMGFVYQSNPTLKAHHFTMDDLLVDVTDTNPSPTASTILLTATATKPANAILLVNAVANGYVTYKTRQAQEDLVLERTYLQNLSNQYKAQSEQ